MKSILLTTRDAASSSREGLAFYGESRNIANNWGQDFINSFRTKSTIEVITAERKSHRSKIERNLKQILRNVSGAGESHWRGRVASARATVPIIKFHGQL
jgi:hypothetical protein